MINAIAKLLYVEYITCTIIKQRIVCGGAESKSLNQKGQLSG